jgi:hypothetical protein
MVEIENQNLAQEKVQEQIEEILMPVQEVLVPATLLPATIPTLQRLKDAPYKFRVLVVNVKKRSAYWVSSHYFLTDGEGLIDIAERTLYYKTRARGKTYKIKVGEDVLPKELKYYTKGAAVDIREYEDEISVLVNMHKILSLQGDLVNCDEKTFVVSLLFRILPHIPLD